MRHTPIRSLNDISPRRAAVTLCALSFLTILGAWIFQWAGYLPCELCLKQRWAYYMGVPIAVGASYLAFIQQHKILVPIFIILALLFAFSAMFGFYHAGVEWGLWQGPTDCTGALDRATSMSDFMNDLRTIKVVRCDAVAIRILGLSLAGWNGLISCALCALALIGARGAWAKSHQS